MRQGRAGPRGIDTIFIYFLPFWGAGGSCLAPCSPVVKPKREEVARLARGCSAGSQSSRPGSKPSPGKRGWQHPVLPGLWVLVGPTTTLKNWGLHKSQHPGQLPLGSTEPPALFCRHQGTGEGLKLLEPSNDTGERFPALLQSLFQFLLCRGVNSTRA